MKITHLFATALLAASFTATALAQDNPATPTTPRALNRIQHRLNITPQQREQARAIIQREQPALQQLHQSLAAERAELNAASASGTFNPQAAEAIAAKYAPANAQATVERAKVRAELLAILTPQQLQQLQQLRSRLTTAFATQLPGLGDTL